MRFQLRLDQLQGLLASSRLSQNHWAIKLGFSRGHWSDIVNGKHPYPSTRTRERMVEVFGVPFEQLFAPSAVAASPDREFREALADRYLIDRELGQGAMGTVHLAREAGLNRVVAIKQVSAEAVGGVGVPAFLREISTLSRLQHPNILPLFAAGSAAGHPYFVMPWVREGSLRDRLNRDVRLSLDSTVQYVSGLAAALEHAHESRVLHCDIKPENILLQDGHAWLTDFGVSRVLREEGAEWRARSVIDLSAGTPAYVSPEQANGESDLDGRADVYSLGCVVYEMLTGRAPFDGASTEIVVSKRFLGAPPSIRDFAPETSKAVAEVVARAMATRREERIASPMAFARELREAAGARSIARSVAGITSRAFTRSAASVRTSGASPAFAFGAALSGARFRRADLHSAWRQAKAAPVLAFVTLMTFAVAIALATTTFSLVDHVLLRPLPLANPERLVVLQSVDSLGNPFSRVSHANWNDLQRDARTLENTAIYRERSVTLRDGESAQRLPGVDVSHAFFATVRPKFLLGGGFTSDEVENGSPTVVVSERLWRRLLGSDSTLRTPLRAVSRDLRVAGVVAAGQEYPAGTDVWIGMPTREAQPGTRDHVNFVAIARLKPGVSIVGAKAELDRIAKGMHAAEPAALYTYGAGVRGLQEELVGDAEGTLRVLLGAVGFVLLIGCANVAAASIGRSSARARELAVRAALGASRGRLFAQLLTEQLALAIVGGAIGASLAWAATRFVVATWGAQIPRASEITMDTRVLAISALITMFAGVLAGVLPALLASVTSGIAGAASRTVAKGGRNIPGAALVTVQIALAMVLMCGATVTVASFRALVSRDLGIDLNVATVEAALTSPRLRTDRAAQYAYWAELRRRLHEIPGVTNVGVAQWTPLSMGGTGFVEVEGKSLPGASAGFRVVSDEYAEALGLRLLAGRMLTSSDNAGAASVVVVNDSVARRYWPGESAIGKRIRATSMETRVAIEAPWRTVVGVVSTVRHFGFEDAPTAEMYVPFQQAPEWIGGMTAVVSARVPIEGLMPAIAEVARGVDRDIAVDVGTMRARAKTLTSARRMMMTLLTLFGTVALALAALGTYGLLAYGVAQRGRELAIRSALGATRAQLMALVVSGAGRIVIAGVAIGGAAAFALSTLIASETVDVAPTDPRVFLTAMLTIGAAAAVATWAPARRAARAEAADALRGE